MYEFKELANQAIDKIENALERLFETTDFDGRYRAPGQ
jgi:frataxin-like iron-binding protein CyaY